MMGNRGAIGGDEHDAFSRRARRLLKWRAGELRKIKRKFSKRTRRLRKLMLRREDAGA